LRDDLNRIVGKPEVEDSGPECCAVSDNWRLASDTRKRQWPVQQAGLARCVLPLSELRGRWLRPDCYRGRAYDGENIRRALR